MTSPCGLDCFNCPVYLAVENQELRVTISKMFGLPIQKASCTGCRNEGGTPLDFSEPYNVYRCIGKKAFNFVVTAPTFPVTVFTHMQTERDKSHIILKSLTCVWLRKWVWNRGQQIRQRMSGILISMENLNCSSKDWTGVALFLASSLSGYVTGDRIIVGGGYPLKKMV